MLVSEAYSTSLGEHRVPVRPLARIAPALRRFVVGGGEKENWCGLVSCPLAAQSTPRGVSRGRPAERLPKAFVADPALVADMSKHASTEGKHEASKHDTPCNRCGARHERHPF